MNIRFYFQKVDKAGQEELRKHLAGKKLDRLARLLQHGNLALAEFVLNAKYHRHHNIFVVRLGLEIAKNNFESEEINQNLIEAFDLALDHLILQLRKVESVRHDK